MYVTLILILVCLEVGTFTLAGSSFAAGNYQSAGLCFGCGVAQALFLNDLLRKKPH